MNRIRIYGGSDDLIEVEGNAKGCNEYDGEKATFHIAGLIVTVSYSNENNGCWGIQVTQIDEDLPVKAENLSLFPLKYSMVLEMDIPEDSYISKVG